MHDLESRFHKHLFNRFQISPDHRIVLGFSGGSDSVALALLLKSYGCHLHLAHVNYGLRGQQSMQDESFCVKFSKTHNLPLHVKRLLPKWLKKGLNLQAEARNIRYAWFKSCKSRYKLNFIATAHHADDLTESIFRNWIHGTGITGFSGIAEYQNAIIRPLLPFTKTEILSYLQDKHLKFQIDESNLKPVYERNQIRLQILPQIQALNPNLQHTLYRNSTILQSLIIGIEEHLKTITKPSKNGIQIKRSSKGYTQLELSVLGYAFNEWGCSYSQIQELLKALKPDLVFKPRTFYTSNHHIYVERKYILISSTTSPHIANNSTIYSLEELKHHVLFNVTLSTQKPKIYHANTLYCDIHKLKFPLLLRTNNSGDTMQPFGMQGRKLISDIIREQKLNRIEKTALLLLCDNENEILWTIPFKTSHHLKITSKDKGPFLKIQFKSDSY